MKKILLISFLFHFAVLVYAQNWTELRSQSQHPVERANSVGFSNGSIGFIALGNTPTGTHFDDCWSYSPSQGSWTRVADFPGVGRKNAIVFSIDSFAFVGAGAVGASTISDMYKYNMNTDTWTAISNYPGDGKRLAFQAVSNGKAYVGGGFASIQRNDFYEYNPNTDQWRQLADLPFGRRASGVSFSIGDTVYFGLGYHNSNDFNDFWAYSVLDSTWTQKANYSGVGRIRANVTIVNDKAVVGGGFELGTTTYLPDYHAYDPSTGQWTAVSSPIMPARAAFSTFSIGSAGYIFSGSVTTSSYENDLWKLSDANGIRFDEVAFLTPRANPAGFSNGTYGFVGLGNSSLGGLHYKDLWKFEPVSNTWQQMADFPADGRKNAMAFSIDSFAYVGAGTTGITQKRDMYRYNMNSDRWDTLANYPGQGMRLVFHAACHGKAYVGGGLTDINTIPNFFNDFYEYDPNTDNWNLLGVLPFSGRSSGVSFTINDTIYFGLGYDGNVAKNDLWAYSINDSTWTQKASFPGLARLRAMAFVINDRAIVGGGFRANSAYTNDYYQYDPNANQWVLMPSFGGANRAAAASFNIANNGYLFGGANSSNIYLNDLWEFRGIITSLERIQTKNESFFIFPNPSEGILQIEVNEVGDFFLYDLKGKEVYRSRIDQSTILDLSFLSKGSYVYQFVNESSLNRGKLIIAK